MLTRLRLKNFKAWEDTGDVALAPLTVLFGANSSGKSSLHQFLMLLQQTVESPDRRRVLNTGDERTPVDLGSFASVLRRAGADSPLEFELDWRRTAPLRVDYAPGGPQARSVASTELGFRAAIGAVGDDAPRPRVESYVYRLGADGADALRLGSALSSALDGGYTVTADGIDLVRATGRDGAVSAPSQFHAFPGDLRTQYRHLDFAADLTFALEEQLRAIDYLGPLREQPDRLYRWAGEDTGNVGWRGEHAIQALLAGRGRTYELPGRPAQTLQVLVAERLKALGVIETFAVERIGAGRDEYEVRVTTPGSGRGVLLTDVGFGVSQVLPVVVGAFHPAPGSTVIMEQPEIHLHPAVQADLADLFLDALAAREDGAPRGTQFIVESHSEHLLRRLLRRIAEERVDPADVRCYVVNRGAHGSTIAPLDIDEYGNVRNWPADFFGDTAADLIAQSRSARDRRKAAQ